MLDKVYKPQAIEEYHYKKWENCGAFSSDIENDASIPFSIVIPPPNVTGSLHMGHALNNALQDVLIRYRRMKGDDVLWQPGTDHAGIATQMIVERQLESENKTRHDLGREQFIKRIWNWKAESGGTITQQLRRLGASCDWSRERFTMDEGLSKAVTKVFVELYKSGLIYRDQRLVNWDPKLQTAISDLEVEQRETVGKLWYFRYPIVGLKQKFITVATTRPETMLGDTAVAVHPTDERYKKLVGKSCLLPIAYREIPIIADEYSDPEKGSGAVKITPAHDFNDFEVGKRNNLDILNIFDNNAKLNSEVPDRYVGVDRFEARDMVVKDIERLGLLEKIEDNEMTIPYGDRSGVVIEPWLTDQWFVDAKTLAAPAITQVKEGYTRFVPSHWEKTYFDWMENIQPWCVSRQIWWGHQIPAWFGPDGEIFVEATEEEALTSAKKHYGKTIELKRDEDVLDTWFSSALWPFSTMGWPENTVDLAKYYPTSVLVTGFDIIFFWVARMMMMGLHFLKEVPFKTVYIHALVRDEKGQKMSKSKGNVMDPLELIDKYGADALRMTLVALAAQGRDIKLSENRVEGYRNFATKLWNAARFCEFNNCSFNKEFNPSSCSHPINSWIISKLFITTGELELSLEKFRFNDAASSIYNFTWGTFCDWYLEFAKPLFLADDKSVIEETKSTVAWVLTQLLRLLHPFMPFITEELWKNFGEDKNKLLINESWPLIDQVVGKETDREIDWVVDLVAEVRSVRSEANVPAASIIPLIVSSADEMRIKAIETHSEIIKKLARLTDIKISKDSPPKNSIQTVIGSSTLILPLGDVIDFEKELERLESQKQKLVIDISKISKKLSDNKFLDKAPKDIVDLQRERLGKNEKSLEKLNESIARLK
tara:strand:- start:2586 stop:5231 length:2646 start_codon:yes stop_codon:yes gene_type:complete